MNGPSSLLANPTLPGVNLQLENIRNGIAHAQGAEGETRLRELKKATQEFEAVFIGYMLKVMRSTVEPADDEGGALGKDVYLSMFDQEIALQMARNSSLGIGEMMYRQLEQTVKETKTLAGTPPSETEAPLPASRRPAGVEHPVPGQPEAPTHHHRQETTSEGDQEAPTAWSAPVEGRLSSAFGKRADPFTQTTRIHRGVDIAARAGAPIRAAQSGTVVFSGHLSGYGNTIILEHAGGYRTLYGHASRNLVNEGDLISTEQVIGEVGSSGRSTGTHLHFELQKGGARVDPKELLLAAGKPAGD
jgi:murein DD-endopeptidase MepM/ murein hydrolase activator NlpD